MEPVPGLDLTQPPFDLLDDVAHTRIQHAVDLGFHRAGTLLIEAGKPSPHVFVMLKGRVHAFDTDAAGHEQRFADYGPGDVFGAWAVMAGRARHGYRADSDTLNFLLPAELFRSLLAGYPAFAAWFQEGLQAKGRLAEQAKGSELAELMVTQVRDAQLAPAIVVDAGLTIADATVRMKEARVDCLLVEDTLATELGVVTRTDLLDAVAVQRLPLLAAVGPLASRPLISVRAEDVLFQALVAMTERQIERVAVRDGDAVIGTVGMAELLSHYASHSHLISLRLSRATTLEEVAAAARGMDRLIRSLHAQGARIPALMELVSALNSRILARVFALLVPTTLQPQLCLLVLGSEGRREQLLKTDQDNALVVGEGVDPVQLERLMQRFTAVLGDMAYPPCPGDVMVSNPHWRMTAGEWSRRIDHWCDHYDAEAAMELAITLDARPVAGNIALFEPIAARLAQLGDDDRLLHQMARAVLQFDTPLTLLGQVRDGGEGADIKKGGVFPVVHGLRCLALKHRIVARNSFERCRALADAGQLSPEMARDLAQTLAVLQRMRLDAQLAALDAGRAVDNRVHVESLRRLDRELLRDALRVVKAFRQQLQLVFRLND